MKLVRFSDKGSGWHKQSGRHSDARKFGFAGGKYAAPTRSKKLRKLTYGQLKKKGVKLSPKGDADHDGVINKKDCRPFNPKMQDVKNYDSDYDTWGHSGNITVGLYSKKTLKDIKEGKDDWATTVFMNKGTFSSKEIAIYPYQRRKSYVAFLAGDDEPIKFYATDVKNAKRFLKAQYRLDEYPLEDLFEEKTTSKKVG